MDYKKILLASAISTLNTKTDKVDFTQNSLLIATATGIITGTPIMDEIFKTNPELDENIDYMVTKSIDEVAKKLNDGVSDAILIKDATLISGNGVKYSLKYLYVFISEIIGISIGNMSISPNSIVD
ncbi:MAG: hypothetical protein HFH54_01485 [Lachnospiraceae bacterium]|nr:hypothetical protein [Lachnospiraceae bacterium]